MRITELACQSAGTGLAVAHSVAVGSCIQHAVPPLAGNCTWVLNAEIIKRNTSGIINELVCLITCYRTVHHSGTTNVRYDT